MSQALATPPYWVDAFLRALAMHGMESKAALAAGTTLRQVNRFKNECIEFESACDEAFQHATDQLESAARERAIRGTPKGVWHKGELVGEEVVYSDSLLQFLLKGHRRDKLGDKTEVTGANGGPITIAIRTFERPTVIEAQVIEQALPSLLPKEDPYLDSIA